jgi:hypothetical protein
MFELRPLSTTAIPAALAKAERYRLLNEPSEAESICLDILAVDPTHQDALTMMLLAITDQFSGEGDAARAARAEQILPEIHDEYARAYFGALMKERRARATSCTSASRWRTTGSWTRCTGSTRRWRCGRPGTMTRAAMECVRAAAAPDSRAGAGGRSHRRANHVGVSRVR